MRCPYCARIVSDDGWAFRRHCQRWHPASPPWRWSAMKEFETSIESWNVTWWAVPL